MMSLIALVAAPVYMMLLAKAPMHRPAFIAAVLPCLFLLLQGNIWIVILTGVGAGILAEVTAGIGKFCNNKWNAVSYVFFTHNLLGGFCQYGLCGLNFSHMMYTCELLKSLRKKDTFLFIITHDFEFIASVCDSVIHIEHGEVVQQYDLNSKGVERLKNFFSYSMKEA